MWRHSFRSMMSMKININAIQYILVEQECAMCIDSEAQLQKLVTDDCKINLCRETCLII